MSGELDKMPETETDAYLTAWAEGVATSVTPDELARLVKDYRELAQNKRRSAADREFARRRAKSLADCRNLTVDEQQL
ncbi:MAG: hypothetical protein AABP62_26930 [Planctomycetota bacterium]